MSGTSDSTTGPTTEAQFESALQEVLTEAQRNGLQVEGACDVDVSDDEERMTVEIFSVVDD